MPETIDSVWAELDRVVGSVRERSLGRLVREDGERRAALWMEAGGLTIDFAKTHLDAAVLTAGAKLADAVDFETWRSRLLTGAIVNLSENRAATHSAERGVGSPDHVAAADHARTAMRGVYDRVVDGDFGQVERIIHIGIGGSFLGPALVIDALPKTGPVADVRIVSNIDAVSLDRALEGAHAERTLVVVVSKSFTTLETMMNARSAMAALGLGPERVIAVTANPEKAAAFGVPEENILGFAETVGGRYSLWTGVGLAAALAVGWSAFEDMLAGAADMDRHFRDAPLQKNLPFVAALLDIIYASVIGAESRAIFAYDERLRLLPDFLQQLETESNGKSVDRQGRALTRPSSPVVWGGVGTDAQHAVFQMLHQGTHLVTTEFLAVREPGHNRDAAHHEQLLANCIAQGAALLDGRDYETALAETGGPDLAHAKTFDGGRPSTTILLERLDARTLGALIVFYEHRTFSFGALLQINSFDQMGVELGKTVAQAIANGDLGDLDPSSRALLDRLTSE
ncbi:MAG: glucose-6-phosphate isomerase [Pacificimonas sp.]|jgi:glucose-6-phosphate isomerase|nr:glucose-6-phosphate isomerase [Pacificimonas sp.]